MLNVLSNVELHRKEAEQIVAEGTAMGYPWAITHIAVQLFCRKEGLPCPDDIFGWVSEGRFSDKQVRDWRLPTCIQPN